MPGQKFDDETPSVSIDDLEYVMACMLREVFIEAFSLKFGEMPESVRQRIDDAHPQELREWIPSIVVASKVEDVFATALQRAIVPFAASVIKRGGGPDVSKMGTLREILEALESHLKDK